MSYQDTLPFFVPVKYPQKKSFIALKSRIPNEVQTWLRVITFNDVLSSVVCFDSIVSKFTVPAWRNSCPESEITSKYLHFVTEIVFFEISILCVFTARQKTFALFTAFWVLISVQHATLWLGEQLHKNALKWKVISVYSGDNTFYSFLAFK